MIAFVILHYKNIDDTLECIKSIKRCSKKSLPIIVVDNNTLSLNDENQIKKYTKDIVLLDKNYGFAKANNIGIKYAYEKYNPDFYYVINNDIIIEQKNYEKIIEEDYKEYSFDFMGPHIDSPTKESTNPFPAFKTIADIEKEINRCNKFIKIYSSDFLFGLLNLCIKLKRIFKKPVLPKNGPKISLNVPLHGCAIVFSNKYIKQYKNAFYNDTFLFHEEEFLYQIMINEHLTSVYDPKLIVFHKEGASRNKEFKNLRLTKKFKEQEKLKSLTLLKSYMERS